jgi:hypothetical protein
MNQVFAGIEGGLGTKKESWGPEGGELWLPRRTRHDGDYFWAISTGMASALRASSTVRSLAANGCAFW